MVVALVAAVTARMTSPTKRELDLALALLEEFETYKPDAFVAGTPEDLTSVVVDGDFDFIAIAKNLIGRGTPQE